MSKPTHTPYLIFIGAIILFSLVSLACGGSTAKQLASAVPTTAEKVQESSVTVESSAPQAVEVTATTAVKASPTPAPEPIELVTQGMGQDGQELGYGFMLKNPNTHFAFESSEYQVAVYNAEGIVVETDSGYINLILPGQQLGVAGTMYLDEGITASTIKVQLNAGDATGSDLTETFTTDKVMYVPDEYFPQVRALITNPYTRDISDIRVSTLLYNAADEIIGGGYTYMNFVKASSSSGESISVTSNGEVARAEVYPSLSGLSMLDTSDELPAGVTDLVLAKSGFGVSGTQLGLGLILQNPNPGHSVEGTMYHVTAFAEDGTILGVSEGYVELLLPNQSMGTANDIYLDEGVSVARIETQLKAGDFSESEAIPTFTAENAAFLDDAYFPKVTGEIVSPFAKDISNLRVTAIAYDEAGEIIGSGYTYLDFVPANSKSAVSITTTVSGTPARVELFAAISALSDIED